MPGSTRQQTRAERQTTDTQHTPHTTHGEGSILRTNLLAARARAPARQRRNPATAVGTM